MSEPIRPNQVKRVLPDYIIDSVNQLIEEKYDGTSFTIKKDDVIAKAFKHPSQNEYTDLNLFERHLYDKKYLDFESVYHKAGWECEYISPDRGDSHFDSYYKFTNKL